MEIINIHETHLISDSGYVIKMLLLLCVILIGIYIGLRIKNFITVYVMVSIFVVVLIYFLYNGFCGEPTRVIYDIEVDGTEPYIEDVIGANYDILSKNDNIWTCEPLNKD